MTIVALRQFLKHPDCIIFVGSGISHWAGLPSWSGLLEELADFLDEQGHGSDLVRREIANGELLQAASFGFGKLTPTSMGAFIKRAVRLGVAKPHAIHKAVINLGPTSFITTNYDTLIEQAIAQWKPDAFFPAPVTNQHLVELADILSARSSHFIFKPHGDANDVSSVILTREQYRSLLPGGERHSALETLKTLLVTRPVLYVGFGLRDPDFSYLRDLLINIYGGATRDHWAIMPDVGAEEIDFWRDRYGIRLLSYTTHPQADGSRDHRELLVALETLQAHDGEPGDQSHVPLSEPEEASQAERILALTRYTAGLSRRLVPTAKPIEVRVSEMPTTPGVEKVWDRYQYWTTTRFLTDGPKDAYLIGLPGSGKSFALRLVTTQMAAALHQACIDDRLEDSGLNLPVLLDLKLYRGDLRSQIDSELPAGFSLNQLRGKLRLKLFLDAFNEIPSGYLEENSLFDSLDALRKEIGEFDFAITSRTKDGLTDTLPKPQFYEIDRFDPQHVHSVLHDHGIVVSGAFADEITALLGRPFYLQLVTRGAVDVPDNASPRDIYSSFVDKLQIAFTDRFAADLQLALIFSKVAYRALESESEAFPLSWLHDQIAAYVPEDATYSGQDVINWLVSREVLIPYSGRRASFVHQSITEYCAAMELARLSRADALSVRDAITSKKWDQCLFMALTMMEPKTAEDLLNYAVRVDLRLAVNAVRYVEEGQAAAVSDLLTAIVNRARDVSPQYFLSLSLRQLPICPEHVTLLKQLIPIGDSIAGEAVQLIAELEGASFKNELFDLLEEHIDDFNFAVNGIAPALMPLIGADDLPQLMALAVARSSQEHRDSTSAISDLLAKFNPSELLAAARGSDNSISPRMVALLCDSLKERHDSASLQLLLEFLLSHPDESTTPFYFFLMRNDQDTSVRPYEHLSEEHVTSIWRARLRASFWDSGLRRVCRHRPDLKRLVEKMATERNGVEAIALRYCAGHDNEELFDEVEELCELSDKQLRNQPFEIFRLDQLDWQGREDLFVQSAARDVPALRKMLFAGSTIHTSMARNSLGLAALRPMIDQVVTNGDDESWWPLHQLGQITAHLGNYEVQAYCLRALAHGDSSLKYWVKAHYLMSADGITTDILDDEMVASLLSDLNVPGRVNEYWYNPLGRLVTERFVNERLIPLATGASTELIDNLEMVLKAAGDRHGKRYIIPT